MIRFFRICAGIVLCLIPLVSAVKGQDDAPIFLYKWTQYNQATPPTSEHTEIRWFPVDNPTNETGLEVPSFNSYAISPTGTHVAFHGIDTGYFYLLNLLDRSLVTIELFEPILELLWDGHFLQSGTMLWSPDGDRLAFTGSVVPHESGLTSDEADVYIYHLATGVLENVTDFLPILREWVTPASWSPDGEWLVIYGAWSQVKDAQDNDRPTFRSGALSRSGEWLGLGPEYRTCRLRWSPDGKWLASDTQCLGGCAAQCDLMLILFDPQQFDSPSENMRRLDQIVSPLRIGWNGSDGWHFSYSSPVWADDHTLVAYRSIGAYTFGIIPPDIEHNLSSNGLIRFDLSTYSENLFMIDVVQRTPTLIGEWFVTLNGPARVAYNPLIEKTLQFPDSVRTCPVLYALRIDGQGDFVAVMDACHPGTWATRVYETATFTEIAALEFSETNQIKPLGFIEQH